MLGENLDFFLEGKSFKFNERIGLPMARKVK
jgi:hypothetical protein